MCIGLFCAGRIGVLGALELEVSAGINNFSFDYDKDLWGDVTSSDFKPYIFLFGNISLRDDISNIMGFSINIERDTIMKTSLNVRFSAKTDYVSVEFGPFIGMDDNFKGSMPDIGIMGNIGLSLPGVGFLSVGGSSTLGSKFDFLSDNIHESAEAKFGLYLPPFLIVSVSAGIKSYTVYEEKNLKRQDQLMRIQASADFYAKNSPFGLRIDGGHQTLSRDGFDDQEYFFAGLEMNIQASQSWRIILGAEVPFLLEEKPIKITDNFYDLFKAKIGFVYTFH